MKTKYYKAASADIVGDVRIDEDASIWYQSVLRGDSTSITIGKGSNIQDGCIVHGDAGFPVVVHDHVTVGHGVILHGCEVGEHTTIGMGAILLNGCKIGKNCMIGAGSLVPQGKVIPDNSLAFGSPVTVKRELDPAEIKRIAGSADHYVQLAKDQLETCYND